MESKTFLTRDRQILIFKVRGNFELAGWNQAEIGVQAEEGTLRVEEEGDDRFRLFALHNCRVLVPNGKKVCVERAYGNARVHDFNGELAIERVNGNLTLQDLGVVSVERVDGELYARRMASLSAGRVAGICLVEDIRETLTIGNIGGSFKGQKIQAAAVERVGGRVRLQANVLSGNLRAGGDIVAGLAAVARPVTEIGAGGDVKLYLQGEERLNLEIRSGAEKNVIDLGEGRREVRGQNYVYTVGEDLPRLVILAGGAVQVSRKPWADMDLSGKFARSEEQVGSWSIPGMAESMRAVEQMVEQSVRLAETAAAAGLEAARKAEEHVREVMRDLDLRFDDVSAGPTVEAAAPETTGAAGQPEEEKRAQGISEEERMFVLQMLQEKKITLEEAEQLLDALEGRPE